MPNRWPTTVLACVGLAGSLLLWPGSEQLSAEGEAAGYVPVAPASAIHGAVESNLNLVRQWLVEKDYASAAEATTGLSALVRLHGHQSVEPEWRKRSEALRDACDQLAKAVERKSAADCDKAIAECTRLLGDMARHPPAGKPAAVKNFKPHGDSKTWMLLMDGAYVDAKRAESAKELEQSALALAEEAHVVAFLRDDAKWRLSAQEVRDAALRTARLAKEEDLATARKALKQVYQRCEACHERSGKK
jgi:hypothetical protein